MSFFIFLFPAAATSSSLHLVSLSLCFPSVLLAGCLFLLPVSFSSPACWLLTSVLQAPKSATFFLLFLLFLLLAIGPQPSPIYDCCGISAPAAAAFFFMLFCILLILILKEQHRNAYFMTWRFNSLSICLDTGLDHKGSSQLALFGVFTPSYVSIL